MIKVKQVEIIKKIMKNRDNNDKDNNDKDNNDNNDNECIKGNDSYIKRIR